MRVPRIARKRAAATHTPKYYRALREADVKQLILARFQSLTDLSAVHMSFPALAKRFRIPVSTCFYAIKMYRQRGLAYVNGRLTNIRPPRTFKLTSAIASYLRGHDTLQKWSGWTLQQRCKQIRKEFGLALSPSGLKRFYNRQGVKFLTCSYIYQQGQGLGKELECYKFCVDLATRLAI